MNEPRTAAKPSPLQAFIDAVAIETYDAQIPPEPVSPKVQQESRIVLGRRRRDKAA